MNWDEINKYTDKFRVQPYLSFYNFIIKNDPKLILEIGVDLGAPYYYWPKLFPGCVVFGIDNRSMEECSAFKNIPSLPVPPNHRYINNDINAVDLGRLPLFDLIVDDGSHWKEEQSFALNSLYKNLSPNGIYIIEDVVGPDNADYISSNFSGDKDKLFIADRRFVRGGVDSMFIIYYNDPNLEDCPVAYSSL
jgi:hypothetical protein